MTPRRVPLACLPTPLVPAPRLAEILGSGPLWIKRDDLTGSAWPATRRERWSVCSATPSAMVATCSWPPAAPAPTSAPRARSRTPLWTGLRAAASPIGLCGRLDQRRHRTGGRSAAALRRGPGPREPRRRRGRASGRTPGGRAAPYPLPRGGATPVGAVGYAYAAREVSQQSAALGIQPDVVVVATGSGTTQAGLVAGQAGYGLWWHVIGASVSRPIDEATERVQALAKACAAELGFQDPNPDDVDVRDLRGAGFGIASPADRMSAELALTSEGLLLDDHYGAQAMTLLRRVLAEERPGSAIFWSTGGLVAALAALGRATPA